MRPRPADRLLVVVLLAVAVGCGGYRAVKTKSPVELVWPSEEPRIRFQSLINLQQTKSRGSARILNWLGGEESVPLFRRPYAIAWDDEDLLVTDPDLGRVARISPGGRITLSPEGLFRYPIGVAVCQEGILVTDSLEGKVAVLDQELQEARWLAQGLSRPTGLDCGEKGVFLVETGAHRIQVLSQDGQRKSLGRRGGNPGEFNFPVAIALDGDTLLVGDTLNFRIQRLDAATGNPVEVFGQLGDSPGETPRIKGVAVDAAGHIWVSDGVLDLVSVYDRDGTFLVSIGGTGAEPGRFSFPAGIAAHPDGRVAVADSLNRRLQIFRLLERGRFEGE